MSLVPEKLISFRVYGGVGNAELFGLADAELPKLEALTDTITGAGIAGELESVALGHFKAMSAKLKWRTSTPQSVLLAAPIQHAIQLRGSAQIQDSGSGATTSQAIVVDIRGKTKSTGLGKLEPGKAMDGETEMTAEYLQVRIAGVKLIEIDVLNFKCEVGGVDHLATVRADLGG